MDPNEALKNAREALVGLRKGLDDEHGDCGDIGEDADDLAVAFEALDGWLSKGGFLPGPWQRSSEPAQPPQPAPLERIATALEDISDHLSPAQDPKNGYRFRIAESLDRIGDLIAAERG